MCVWVGTLGVVAVGVWEGTVIVEVEGAVSMIIDGVDGVMVSNVFY